MMARVTMLAMHKDGLITLPPPRWERGRQKPIVFGPDTEPTLFPAPTTLDDVRSLDLRTVVRGTQGRGRYDRDRQYDKPKKDVWLRPLRRDWKRTLNRKNRPGEWKRPR